MAKLPGGLLTSPRGKIGGVVGSVWKGIAYIREYVIPSNPKTTSQTLTRNKFGDLVRLAQTILGAVLQPYWDPLVQRNSGFAHFVGVNRPLYTTRGNYSSVQISRGTLEGAVITTCTLAAGVVTVAWDPDVLGNGANTDRAVCVVYDKLNNVAFTEQVDQRENGESNITVGLGRTNTNLQAWLFFVNSVSPALFTKASYSDWSAVT
jgi:hypothetical protein